jgi:hypothetical protein
MLLSTITFEMEKDPWYMVGGYNAKKSVAMEMKKRGADVEFIAEISQLPLEEIQML